LQEKSLLERESALRVKNFALTIERKDTLFGLQNLLKREYEENLSAKQDPQKKSARIQEENAHQGRKKSSVGQKKKGPQAPYTRINHAPISER
jgi:hypothetical protein